VKTVKEKFSILIPVHNEAKRIRHNLKEVKETLDNLGCNYEIVAINDGSSDNSYQILKELKKVFKYASGDLIVWLDADLDLHPFQIKTLYDIMELNDADIVIGSKMHPNSKVNYPC